MLKRSESSHALDSVTYEQDRLAHVKTEFGFDVLEVAHGRYAPDSYHDFIGFGVSAPLLEQAFQETYGLDLKSVLADEDKVLGSYRRDVSQLLPRATRIAWSLKKDEIMKDQPGMTKKRFLYNLSRASYQKNWGRKNYQPPTFGENRRTTELCRTPTLARGVNWLWKMYRALAIGIVGAHQRSREHRFSDFERRAASGAMLCRCHAVIE